MRNSFHGRTFGAMSATGQAKYKDPFKPILPSFIEAEFNNFNDLVAKLTEKTIAVLMEPIQGEGGINIASQEYIKEVKEFCERNSLLFIFDEVQTGMGRTGKLFAFQHYGVIPDIMLLSKGLGAGVPISAIVAGPKVYDLISPGMHASTFGGGPLVTKTSLETFKIIKEEKLLKNAERMGKYLTDRLEAFKKKFNFIKEIRSVGLMVGMELTCDSFPVFSAALDKGLIVNSTHQTVLRIMPALNVTRAEIDKGMTILGDVLAGVVAR
jgi:acetylornithine/N-succinyldiaminopimelate aminotransferase